ncbi:MAG: PEP-CTERM sorting domain-containing protein [Microcystis panniformis]
MNPSNDDNVFGMFITSEFKITATPVPEPSMTLGIFGIGAIGALISRRGKKS